MRIPAETRAGNGAVTGRTVVAVLLIAGWAPLVRAADCGPDADQTTLSQCADEDYRAADAVLNERYRAVVRRLADSPDAKALLTAAQRAWIGFRNGECAFVASSVAGGSVYPMIASECLAEMTRVRSAQLQGYLDCKEGDLSCPLP